MINRSAAATSVVLVLVMLAATLWRIPLLPGWAYGPNGAPPPIRNPLGLFVVPACVGFVGAVLALKKWVTPATADVEPWRRWGSQLLVAYALMCTLFHLSSVAGSVGVAGPFSRPVVTRAVIVLSGSLIVVFANQMPKLPWLPSRFGTWQLDAVRGQQLLRSGGQLLVLWGVAAVIGALVMPLRMMVPLIVSITTALVLIAAVRRLALHRQQSRERFGSRS